MTASSRDAWPPVTVRELVGGDIVGLARVDFEDDGSGGGRNVIVVPGGLARGRYELEFEDGTRFVARLEPQIDDHDRLDVVEVE